MTINKIRDNAVYKQVLKDSFGGVMYSADKVGDYDATEIITMWDNLTEAERESAGGIMKGVFSFLKGDME